MSPLISEDRESPPILIVDRKGFLGEALAKKLSLDSTVALVSEKEPISIKNIIHIPFQREIPRIPENVYSHIFIIDDGKDITIGFLSSFLNKAREDKSTLCFCTTLDNQENVPEELFEYRKSKTIFLGDVFPNKGKFPNSYISRFINSAKNKGKINIPQEGMATTYPVFFDDAILGILEIAFGISSEKTYFVFPKSGITLLSLAHIIQKNDPDIKIDFSQEKPIEVKIKREGRYVISNSYPLEEKIKSLKISAGHFERRIEEDEKKDFVSNKTTRLDWKIPAFAIILFLFLPLITTLFFSFVAFLSLDSQRALNSNSKYFLNLSKFSFGLAENFSRPLTYEMGLLSINPFSSLLQSISQGKSQVSEALDYYNSFDLFSQGKTNEAIMMIKNFLLFSQNKKNFNLLGPQQQNFIAQTINVWPQILAVNSKKTYLILFQNNSTLRPTGGLIQDFGVLSLNNGKISDFKLYKTEDSDKNLKGHVEPPFALRRFLKVSNLLMGDSNFNPDFGESAISAAFFANLEEGYKTDGVIAVDLYTLQKLEETLGDNTPLTDTNNNFLLGSISKVFKNLVERNPYQILFSNEIVKLLGQKHIIFYFNDQSMENIFATNGFSSTLLDNRISSQNAMNDFISISEADLGIPVTDIKRSLIMKTDISSNGKITSDLSMEYKNLGEGDYNNYLRVIIPIGVSIEKIKIDGQDTDFENAITDPSVYEAKDFVPPQKLEVESYTESNKNFYGFFIIMPKGSSKKVEVIYSFDALSSLPGLSSFSYNLKFLKQPGVDPYPFNFSITYPDSFKTGGKTSFLETTDTDFDLNLNFSKK